MEESMAAKSMSRDAEDGRNESGQDISGAHSMDGSDEDVQNKHNESGASDDGVDAEDNSNGNATKKAHNNPRAWMYSMHTTIGIQ